MYNVIMFDETFVKTIFFFQNSDISCGVFGIQRLEYCRASLREDDYKK